MYPDPARVRSQKVTVRLDEYEHKLLIALAEYQGEQLSTLLRQMVMREAHQVMVDVAGADMPGSVAPATP